MAMQMLEHQNYENDRLHPESLSPESIKKIQALCTYILDKVSEPLTIEILSRVSGLGPKKLQTGFKLLFSKSVNEYIRELKLEIARDALTNSDSTISEIVYNIGFSSRSYFSKIFSERYGILPNKYRSSLKKVPHI
jgi:AraC-like DNA-binding protein